MYIIPEELIQTFQQVSASNFHNGKHVETLGFLFGYKSNENLVGTDLIFPEQEATCSRVDDKGKFTKISKPEIITIINMYQFQYILIYFYI